MTTIDIKDKAVEKVIEYLFSLYDEDEIKSFSYSMNDDGICEIIIVPNTVKEQGE